MKCNRCRQGLSMLIGKKLGRCSRCIRLSAIGAVVSWAILAVLYTMWPVTVLVGVALASATLFTLLWLSHAVARLVIVSRLQAQTHDEQQSMPRREFIPAVARVLGVVGAFGLGVLGRPRTALAEDDEGEAQVTEIEANGVDECKAVLQVTAVGCSLRSEARACSMARKLAQRTARARCRNRPACDPNTPCHVVGLDETCVHVQRIDCGCNIIAFVCCVTYVVVCGCD